jgi:hypothetical protein
LVVFRRNAGLSHAGFPVGVSVVYSQKVKNKGAWYIGMLFLRTSMTEEKMRGFP